jgi:hypothetical protein
VWLRAYQSTLEAQTAVIKEGMRIGGYVNPIFGAGDIANQSLRAAHRIERTAVDGAVRFRQAGKK